MVTWTEVRSQKIWFVFLPLATVLFVTLDEPQRPNFSQELSYKMWIRALLHFWEMLWGHVDQKHRKFVSLEGDTSGQDCASCILRCLEDSLILTTWNFHCQASGWSFQQIIMAEIAQLFLVLRLRIRIMWRSEITFRKGFWGIKVCITGNQDHPTEMLVLE